MKNEYVSRIITEFKSQHNLADLISEFTEKEILFQYKDKGIISSVVDKKYSEMAFNYMVDKYGKK